MKRLLSKTFVITAAAVLFAAFGATPAGATAVGGAVLTGTITPNPVTTAAGLPPGTFFGISTSQTGTAAGTINGQAATCSITLNTSGTTNVATGSGSGNLTCNGNFVAGGSFSVSCDVTWVQTGGLIQVSGGCSGPAGTALSATCGIQVAATTIVTECEFTIDVP